MHAIETKGLVKKYKTVTAVNGLNLTIEQGELFALLGVNGAMVKAHGNSTGTAIMNAVRQARKMVEGDVVSRIQKGVEELSALYNEERN